MAKILEDNRRPVRRITGEQVAEAFGGSTEQETVNRNAEFTICNPGLALKLNWTDGMQELRNGRATGNVANQQLRDQRETGVSLLREADELLQRVLFRMEPEIRQQHHSQILLWTSGFPPLASDFTPSELEVLEDFDDSPLVELYLKHIPRRANPEVVVNLGHQATINYVNT